MITIPYKLNWMTEDEWKDIWNFYGLVCDYEMKWQSKADYEAWCKRILEK